MVIRHISKVVTSRTYCDITLEAYASNHQPPFLHLLPGEFCGVNSSFELGMSFIFVFFPNLMSERIFYSTRQRLSREEIKIGEEGRKITLYCAQYSSVQKTDTELSSSKVWIKIRKKAKKKDVY